jgi:hypothetical protein
MCVELEAARQCGAIQQRIVGRAEALRRPADLHAGVDAEGEVLGPADLLPVLGALEAVFDQVEAQVRPDQRLVGQQMPRRRTPGLGRELVVAQAQAERVAPDPAVDQSR